MLFTQDHRPSGPAHRRLNARAATARLRGEGTDARRAWRTTYRRSIATGDVLAATAATAVSYLFHFGPAAPVTAVSQPAARWFALLMPVVWLLVMGASRSYEERFLWIGPEEYRRVFRAALMLLAGAALVSWALKLDLARGFVMTAIPLAAVLTLAQRWVHRKILHRRRTAGEHVQTTIIVGHRSAVAALHEQIDREAHHGYRVIGCLVPPAVGGTVPPSFDGLPVLGDLSMVAEVVSDYQVDTVAVLPCPELDGPALRSLGWELESTKAELLLAPAVTEVVGTRVAIRPVSGLPLLHVERPEFGGPRRLAKTAFDKVSASLLLLVLLPVFVAIMIAIKVTSPGPVFYRHERVGLDGQPFHVLKFRSMVPGADRQVDTLFLQNEGNDVQFKMKSDPRVTGVGAFLRRYSLDELPQLLNVLGGSMSLVGPRPHVTREVEQYGHDMRRRLLVKPGITGLWQVSGRSDLSWDESVRIDVRYVENWSLSFDFMILAKTVGAVVRSSGAY
ncbi:UDP-phosphate galactose phosphotransferase [Geodermatophilus sp. Leaf369]|uniref:sugar transferase n=1 Tax=Geodermatophilus sp. Leaf369 TaxID=1736354 RepID=UPI0006F447FE|nr:sugar transferase [Geodermatophilus sp. Leaf369]KQS60649.1 UDP-phosphate galactose phosphotransferase [Geodermatophilus sp. Leaf369]QNG37262.1 sugar transferase [Geodermatophilaceae bacterium NBWT11]